jgi:hypothetical protein
MIIKTQEKEYDNAIAFMMTCKRKELEEVFSEAHQELYKQKKSTTDLRKNSDYVTELFEVLNMWGWYDVQVIKEILKQRHPKYMLQTFEGSNSEYFIVSEVLE